MSNSYFELLTGIQFFKDTPAREVQYGLSRLIAAAMSQDKALRDLHKRNEIKKYSFCSPYPIEKDKVYRSGRLYCFNLRTPDLKFALAMKNILPGTEGMVKVIMVELRNYQQRFISELISLTPIICTVNNRSWLPEDGLGLLAERLQSNTLKKCRQQDPLFVTPPELFFDSIELMNRKPMVVPYKKTVLLGHKICLRIKAQEWAQQLAFTVLSRGALEKNGQGFGYCIIGGVK